jgi:hypothetical protein
MRRVPFSTVPAVTGASFGVAGLLCALSFLQAAATTNIRARAKRDMRQL